MNKKLKYITAFSVVISQFACIGISAANVKSVGVESHKQEDNGCKSDASQKVRDVFSNIYKYTTKVLACAGLACGVGIAVHGVLVIMQDLKK